MLIYVVRADELMITDLIVRSACSALGCNMRSRQMSKNVLSVSEI